ncbi:MAG: beta-galactosidase [Solobacterium sp.]|jgi:beta-galactosidase|nr:beta-galactosidase [Solobacterium sp.]MCH4221922.1 beta-galactosidase [Solobacterium sp.]MCH4265236.1 beta-galactosidase [Solobacterium sp.]
MIITGVDYYPEQWDRSMWEDDIRRMSDLGIRTVRIGEFAWCRLEPEEGQFEFGWLDDAIELIERYGMKVILGTPTNCPPLWMFQNYPDTLQCDRDGTRTKTGIRGHRCMNSPTFRKYAGRIVALMAERYADNGIYAWQIDNELESNHCTCEYCAASFRKWLQDKYGTLDHLNRAWGNVVWSGEVSDWNQINAFMTAAVNRADWFNPGYMLDYERFCAASTTDYVHFQCDIIRKYIPSAVITTNSCFGSNLPDFHQEFEPLDVASYDNYPPAVIPANPEKFYSNAFALDFVRGFKQKNFWVLEQLGGPMGCWSPITPQLEPGMLEGYAMQAVAHGADLLSFFRWRTASTGAEMFCYGLLDHDNQPNSRTEELKHLIHRLELVPNLSETSLTSKVAMLYSADQEFSFKTQAQSEGFAYWTQMRLFHEACMNLGVNIDIIPQSHSYEDYEVVIVPTQFVTDKDSVKRLEQFAQQGGTVIVTNRSGVKDEHGNCIINESLPTLFRKMCGCYINGTDAIGPRYQRIRSLHGGVFSITSWCDMLVCETAEPMAVYLDRFYAGTPALSVNQFGKGTVYYVGTVGEKALYRSLLLEVFHQRKMNVIENLPDGVESTVRSAEDMQFRFFFNNTLEGKSFFAEGKRVSMQALEMKVLTRSGQWI